MSSRTSLEHRVHVVGRRGAGQDRCRIVHSGHTLLVALADGAGGLAGGAEAAQAVADSISSRGPTSSTSCAVLLGELDLVLARSPVSGETTAVLISVSEGRIEGASVGDSVALLVDDERVVDLTESQHRKPLVGSGEAVPVGFSADLGGRALLLATDGLHKYWRPSIALRALSATDWSAYVRELVDSVRLRNGELHDDIGLALVRAPHLVRS